MPRLLLSLLVLLAAARTAAAQEGAVLRGVVVDSATGAPIEGARVALGSERKASTDRQGRFTLCGLPAGPSAVRARSMFHAEREVPVDLASGDTARVSVVLGRSGVIRVREAGDAPPEALLIVDGVRVFHSWSGCETAPPGMPTEVDLDPDEVESLVVLKGAEAVRMYGPDAKHGALVVTTKRKVEPPTP
jgi:hypothetical protein